MIGRGTRLAPELVCMDNIEGEYVDKRRFYIFDYCSNFTYFGENPNGIEGCATYNLSEKIFSKQVELISMLQGEKFSHYMDIRGSLVDTIHNQILD